MTTKNIFIFFGIFASLSLIKIAIIEDQDSTIKYRRINKEEYKPCAKSPIDRSFLCLDGTTYPDNNLKEHLIIKKWNGERNSWIPPK